MSRMRVQLGVDEDPDLCDELLGEDVTEMELLVTVGDKQAIVTVSLLENAVPDRLVVAVRTPQQTKGEVFAW